MPELRYKQHVMQPAITKASLTRLQTYVQVGARKSHDLQVRFEELQHIFLINLIQHKVN
jgi:hypothetical protein